MPQTHPINIHRNLFDLVRSVAYQRSLALGKRVTIRSVVEDAIRTHVESGPSLAGPPTSPTGSM